MKTKIIYISGNEIFDMNDIRGAFDKVRAALGLDNDTVLFGVPVDTDDAIADYGDKTTISIINADTTVAPKTENTPDAPEQSDVATIAEPENDEIPEPAPAKPVKRGRGRPKAATPAVDAAPEIVPTPIIESNADDAPGEATATDTEPATDDDDAPVIPILSVLASKEAADTSADTTDTNSIQSETNVEPTEMETDIVDIDVDVAAPTEIDTAENPAPVAVSDSEIITDDLEQVQLADMVADEAPDAPVEKTLEVLLESMKPLSEDFIAHTTESDIADDTNTESFAPIMSTNDTDETLQKLAAEFAETEDTIISTPKVESHGKIGKLKNILPFKKAKRDDGGLMGDLFGWAGIAANDEDFSIPGFFTTAASKK